MLSLMESLVSRYLLVVSHVSVVSWSDKELYKISHTYGHLLVIMTYSVGKGGRDSRKRGWGIALLGQGERR